MFVDYSQSHIRRWKRPGRWNGIPDAPEPVVEFTVAETGGDREPTGFVVVSVEQLEQLLAAAGWERAS